MKTRTARSAVCLVALAACGGAVSAQVQELVLTNGFFPQLEDLGGIGGGTDTVLDFDLTPGGTRMVVATPSGQDNACFPDTTSGVLYIYDYNPLTRLWDEFQSIAPGCGNFGVGSELAISDNGRTIIVGSDAADSFVTILEETSGQFVPVFTRGFPLSNLGTSVDIAADASVAIASDMPNNGDVEIYRNMGGEWQLTEFLSNVTNSTQVAIDADWAVIGAGAPNPTDDSLRFFRDIGTTFVETQSVIVPFARGGLNRLELNGNVAAIVTPKGGGAPEYIGVRIIERDPATDLWSEVFVDTSVDFTTQGRDVDIDGDRIVVGAGGAGQIGGALSSRSAAA